MSLKKWLKDPNTLGWLIWAVVSLALLPLCVYFMFAYTYETATPMMRVMVGIFMAAIAGGLVTWVINDILFRIRRRRHNAARADKKRDGRKK